MRLTTGGCSAVWVSAEGLRAICSSTTRSCSLSPCRAKGSTCMAAPLCACDAHGGGCTHLGPAKHLWNSVQAMRLLWSCSCKADVPGSQCHRQHPCSHPACGAPASLPESEELTAGLVPAGRTTCLTRTNALQSLQSQSAHDVELSCERLICERPIPREPVHGEADLLDEAADVLALGCVPAALKPRALVQAAGQGEHLRRLPQLPEALLAQGLQYPVLPGPACSAPRRHAQLCILVQACWICCYQR